MSGGATFIMYAVAAVAGLAGAIVVGRRARDEAAVYRHRIAGTMLLALAAILAAFATAARTMGEP
jgi:drug/metabolite transporter superfamily protein YnfA